MIAIILIAIIIVLLICLFMLKQKSNYTPMPVAATIPNSIEPVANTMKASTDILQQILNAPESNLYEDGLPAMQRPSMQKTGNKTINKNIRA